jgi:hypothetical protein
MDKRIGLLLAAITLGSIGLAVYEWRQLRAAREVAEELRANVDADLSGDPASPPGLPPSAAEMPPPSPADLKLIEELQARVARLQAELAAAQAPATNRPPEKDPAASAPAAAPAAPATNASWRARMEERLAQLKRDDPARFEALAKQREEFTKRIQTQADERVDYLKKVDTSAMTEEQRANHEKLLQAITQAQKLLTQMETLSPEEAGDARRQLFEAAGSLPELCQQERRYLLEQTGQALGYQAGAESAQFADYIQQIYDQTSLPRLPGFRGGNRGGNRGGGASGVPGVGAPGGGGAGAATPTPPK